MKQEYKEHKIQMGILTEEIKKEQELLKKEKQKIEIEKQKFTDEYEYIQNTKIALEKKERNLQTYEQRLKDLKLALTEDNNG